MNDMNDIKQRSTLEKEAEKLQKKKTHIKVYDKKTLKKIDEVKKLRERQSLNPEIMLAEMKKLQKTPSVERRFKFLQDQKRINYINEYERILGLLTNINPGLPEREHLEKRRLELKDLATKSLRPEKNRIFYTKKEEEEEEKRGKKTKDANIQTDK
jgi:hypothetical protein